MASPKFQIHNVAETSDLSRESSESSEVSEISTVSEPFSDHFKVIVEHVVLGHKLARVRGGRQNRESPKSGEPGEIGR